MNDKWRERILLGLLVAITVTACGVAWVWILQEVTS